MQRDTDTPDRYLAYNVLPGARYNPVATAAPRPVAVQQVAGLQVTRGASGAGTARPLCPADAAAAIDGLEGLPWTRSPHAPAHVRAAAEAGAVQVGSWWDDFWSWLKGAVATVTDVIVSAAEEVYVGVRVLVDGVAYVLQQIIRSLEDAASAIASFFRQLAKAIEDVVEALAVLFQFEEIKKTQTFLKGELLARVDGVQGNARYPGFAGAIRQNAVQPLDAFFKGGEQGISSLFDSLACGLAPDGSGCGAGAAGGDVPLTGLRGAGATPHSAFTVRPKGGGPPASHAPQSSWAMQKLKAGLAPPAPVAPPRWPPPGWGARWAARWAARREAPTR